MTKKLRDVPFESLKIGDRVKLPNGDVLRISELFSNKDIVICRDNGTGEILISSSQLLDRSGVFSQFLYLGEKE